MPPPATIRIQDVADILIMSFFVYQLYTWFRKTRAIQILLGLGVVTLIYFATRFMGLYMTSWILQELGTVLIILMIVVFQTEIRQALYRFNLLRNLFENRQDALRSQFQEIVEPLFAMANHRTGAIIVLQRDESLADLMLNGVRLDCEISPQMLESVFYDGAPFHDGAVLIKDGRIAQAACHLPLSVNPDLPRFLGTRHRAALGLSERTDAVILVVSEERGVVSLVVGGELKPVGSAAELMVRLEELFTNDPAVPRCSLGQRLFSNLLPKAAVLLLVSVFWAMIATRQGQVMTVTAPVRLHGVPEGVVLVRSTPEEVDVQLKSQSMLTPAPSKLDLTAEVDASEVRDGQVTLRIRPADFNLPSGVTISAITPSSIRITAEKKVRRTVPVRLALRGVLTGAVSSYRVISEPGTVEIEGPASQVGRVEAVFTEEVDAARLTKGTVYQKYIQTPSRQVQLVQDSPVTIRLVLQKKRR